MPPIREDFESELDRLFGAASAAGHTCVEVVAAELHRAVGGYPGPAGNHRMPLCCSVMLAAMSPGDEILTSPPNGRGATLRIRFTLPRGTRRQSSGQSGARLGTPVDGGGVGVEAEAATTTNRGTGRTVVALVSCVKSKRAVASPARELYVSPLFKGMRAYAETRADAWYILSAEHGVLHKDQITAPYERTLENMSKHDRQAWAERVQGQLIAVLPAHADIVLLAGQRYRRPVEAFLRQHGHSVVVPMEGLGFGKQLKWLKQETDARSDLPGFFGPLITGE